MIQRGRILGSGALPTAPPESTAMGRPATRATTCSSSYATSMASGPGRGQEKTSP
ncbi:hypothetical protein [Streptomyces cyaneofuscatus]|uniref:hypothetical protein n=1 Tax=Streptomyces cyaneofuscatus TaxID=66883 RepID=UPI0037F1A0E3